MKNEKYRIFPFYFPQFYSTPENNKWWGEGFTDWELVKVAKGVDSEQVQPRLPVNGFYDQSSPDVIASQAALAKKYGVSGFNFYHYWFDGKVLLDAPINNLYHNKNIDIEYFFTWANETWTRQWIGKPNDVLIEQEHKPDEHIWESHYKYLRMFFFDSRYVKINNKPMFCIYRAELIKNLDKWVEFINKKARLDGFSGIHLVALRAYEISDAGSIYKDFDMIVNFQPRFSINSKLKKTSNYMKFIERILRRCPESIQLKIARLHSKKAYKKFNYNDYILSMKDDAVTFNNKPIYPVVFPDWDNAPRYKERATFFSGVSIELFKTALDVAKEKVATHEHRFIFINAWNEWSESAYLEADTKNGYQKLDVVRETFKVNESN
ncbi:TPA: glycoside hydrolase family 99-like domain-containing protein [Aeromonas salmonicida]|nr:glycoside hydrolase family 99-like domain-containing protein [Aeromonas salmonicida]